MVLWHDLAWFMYNIFSLSINESNFSAILSWRSVIFLSNIPALDQALILSNRTYFSWFRESSFQWKRFRIVMGRIQFVSNLLTTQHLRCGLPRSSPQNRFQFLPSGNRPSPIHSPLISLQNFFGPSWKICYVRCSYHVIFIFYVVTCLNSVNQAKDLFFLSYMFSFTMSDRGLMYSSLTSVWTCSSSCVAFSYLPRKLDWSVSFSVVIIIIIIIIIISS